MKRFNIGFLILTGLLAGVAAAQSDSLADAARKHKQQQAGKPVAAKVYTNDNLPATETISTVGAPASEAATTSPTDGQATADGSTPATKDGASPPTTPKPGKRPGEDWRDKIQKQKASLEQMQKETKKSIVSTN